MKKLITLTVLLTIGILTYGQFEKNYDLSGDADECHSMKHTPDGGFVMSGASWFDDTGWYDMSILKVDDEGTKEWIKSYGVGMMNIEVAYEVLVTDDGGYMLAGGTDGFSTDGETDFWVVKTDANGDSLWTNHYGGEKSEYIHAAVQATDKGYLFVGATNSFGAGFDDIYLVRTKEDGDTLWTKTYGTNKMDCGYGVQQTADGGFVIAGDVANGKDAYVIKIDTNGNKVWDYIYEGVGTDNFYSVIETTDGNYIAAGRTQSEGAGGQDVFLVKLDSDGAEVWKKTYGGEKKDEGWSVVETADHGFFITGYTESFSHDEEDSDLYAIKTDSDGEVVWSKNYGTIKDDGGYAGAITSDGGYASAGYTYVQNEGTNFYLLKLDSEGMAGDDTEAPSVPQNLSATAESSTSIALSWDNSSDNVAVVGYKIFQNGVLIDSTQYTSYTDTALTTDTEYTYTVSAYDAAGNESAQSASASATPGVGVNNLTAGQLNIYPNPVINTATIEFLNPNNRNFTLNITNLNGQVVKTITNITNNKVMIEKGNLPSGVYFIELLGDKYQHGVVVVE